MDNYQRKLFITYNQARAKARNNPKLLQRIHKAFAIIQTKSYYVAEKELYNPTQSSCNCKDWEFRHAHKRDYHGHCKHMIAEVLISRINKIQYQQLDFLGRI